MSELFEGWSIACYPRKYDLYTTVQGNSGLFIEVSERNERPPSSLSQEELEQVTRFIAAAPDMLKALKRIKETGVFLGAIAQEMMESAIAKAEGVQP